MHPFSSHHCFCYSDAPQENNRLLLRRVIDDRFGWVQIRLFEEGKINLATEAQQALRDPIVTAVCSHLEWHDLSLQRNIHAQVDRELSRMLRSLFPARKSSFLASIKRFLPFGRSSLSSKQ